MNYIIILVAVKIICGNNIEFSLLLYSLTVTLLRLTLCVITTPSGINSLKVIKTLSPTLTGIEMLKVRYDFEPIFCEFIVYVPLEYLSIPPTLFDGVSRKANCLKIFLPTPAQYLPNESTLKSPMSPVAGAPLVSLGVNFTCGGKIIF